MSPDDFQHQLEALLADRRAVEQFRQRRVMSPIDSTHVTLDGRRVINFCSNNYLGLTHHPRIIEAMRQALATHGAGAGAAPLISGQTDLHQRAEADIARWKGAEAAVLLPSGYQANHAAVQMLASVRVRFLIDKLAHASLLDAVRSTSRPYRVFPHNHLPKLRRLLDAATPGEAQVVVTESVFSMDGDLADLQGLADLKKRYPFVLLLDEAHGSGVYGAGGAGLAQELGHSSIVDLSIVTLSKAAGVQGGAVCGSRSLVDGLINFGRASIYSTSLSPALAAGISAAIEVMHDEPQRQARVRANAAHLRDRLTSLGVAPGHSPIVPILLGDAPRAMAAMQRLLERGFWVAAVRPPTVGPNSSRLRVTVSCDHTSDEIDRLADELLSLASA